MINNLEIDLKTCAAFYEYNYRNTNKILYGDFEVPVVSFEELLKREIDIDNVIQTVERELYNYEIDKSNFKTLIKKVVILMKKFLIAYNHKYSYGYNNVVNDFRIIVDPSFEYDLEKIIKTKDKNCELENFTHKVLENVIEGRKKYEESKC